MDGVQCTCMADGGVELQPSEAPEKNTRTKAAEDSIDTASTVVITDNRVLALEMAKRGVVCIGCDTAKSHFFEGAVLTTDTLESLDALTIEEFLLRATGRPVTIAVTERLLLREIAEQDLPVLCQMDRQFAFEKMAAYIRHAYRFYGYGLWSVLLHDGTLIGCCGFSDGTELHFGVKERDNSSGGYLELQYTVAERYRRQGYGEEMCRAALAHACVHLGAREIWIRVEPENKASIALAQKLGFQLTALKDPGYEFYMLTL